MLVHNFPFVINYAVVERAAFNRDLFSLYGNYNVAGYRVRYDIMRRRAALCSPIPFTIHITRRKHLNIPVILGWVLAVPVAVVIVFATYRMFLIRSTYRKYRSVNVLPGISGQQAGRKMLDLSGLHSVRVEELGESRKPWESYYDMTDRVLRLSPAVFKGGTASDIGMVAYECGHAIEHGQGINAKARQRTGILTFAGANLGLLLFVIGLASSGMSWGIALIGLGFLVFAATSVMVLTMWPAEKGTARRAEALLESSAIVPAGSDAQKGTHSMIQTSTWYYVGALSSIIGLWLS